MVRTFQTHHIRKQQELTGKLWKFTVLEGEHQGESFPVFTPSCWETYPGFASYRGQAEYETLFTAEGAVRLEFKGVSHMAWVYVDDKKVAEHYNAYTPFSVVLLGLKAGEHTLRVRVDNAFKEEYPLNFPNDYMSYGGINRAVVCEEINKVYLTKIHITPEKKLDRGWQAKIEVFAENITGQPQMIQLSLVFEGEELTMSSIAAAPGIRKIYEEMLTFPDAEDWSMEQPKLYYLQAKLLENGVEMDDLIERIGFRRVETTEKRILMNGKPLRIKGVNRHEDHPQYGCALPASAIAYDLRLIKDMGANSVRTSHYPNDEIFLDLCDELGILVWEEHHMRAGDEAQMRLPLFEQYAEQVIREMIETHYNHPSIYIWGILNECASDTEYGRSCYEKQYDLIRSLDASRPCSSASCKFEKDLCMHLPDVVSWNMYPYWYEKRTAAEMVDWLYQWSMAPKRGEGKPFLITEIGAGAVYGFRSPDKDPWTEEYQAEAIEKQLTEVMAYEDCIGLYIWQFCDIRVNKEWFAARPKTRNNKGIVDEYRRRKLSYDVVKRLFHACPDYWEQ